MPETQKKDYCQRKVEMSSFELLIFAKDGRGLVCSLFADFALSEFDPRLD